MTVRFEIEPFPSAPKSRHLPLNSKPNISPGPMSDCGVL
jgi:hypothetical protein